jgi:hypothetical protein
MKITIGSSWRDAPALSRCYSLPASDAVKRARLAGVRRLVFWKRHFYVVEVAG